MAGGSENATASRTTNTVANERKKMCPISNLLVLIRLNKAQKTNFIVDRSRNHEEHARKINSMSWDPKVILCPNPYLKR